MKDIGVRGSVFKLALVGFCALSVLAGCAHKDRKEAEDPYGTRFFEPQDRARPAARVNGLLWRASLETLKFLPLAKADPVAGVITSDWYSAPNVSDERVKVQVFILGRDLRADTLRVSVFRQVKSVDGTWHEADTQPGTANKIEDAILTMARQIRLREIGDG
jgi:Domain of unknown function (DUF3576)